MRVVYSPQYRSVRSSLSQATRLALDIAEREIVNDPSPGHHRRELSDGAFVDYSVEDLLIRYRQLAPDVIEFERVLDLRTID
jgi:hypothetical protein